MIPFDIDPERTCWYVIDLTTIPDYEVFKSNSLAEASAIIWAPVNAFLLDLLKEVGPYGDLVTIAYDRAPDELRRGVEYLLSCPPDIRPTMIYDGGHRSLAMKAQGERLTVGCSYVAD